MKPLRTLIESLHGRVTGSDEVPITEITFDSRNVQPGALYVALRGARQDGHNFAAEAVAKGARAVLSDRPMNLPQATVVQVPDTLAALSQVSVRFWDHPSRKLLMIGLTGTNGKTTTSYLIESILRKAGLRPGVLGTIDYRFEENHRPAPNTTPFSSDLQRFLGAVVSGGGKSCVMEVSSHALALGRVEGVEFDVAVFTNLTQDHLDFHQTLEQYAAAKARLFESLNAPSSKTFPKCAVVNGDDSWTPRMLRDCRAPSLTYRLSGPADLVAENLECDASGSRFRLRVRGASIPVRLPLLGEYNVHNALAAVGAACSQGIDLETIRQGVEQAPPVPGRMERVDVGQPFTVVVDYAHTEDALRQVLTTLRKLKPSRILTLFGCGGDRDRTKRPLMGETAAKLSEEVIVTSDNPRSEDPAKIALDIEVGVRRVRSDHYQIVLDRREAIARALDLARSGDILLIAGKGHETYQIIGKDSIPFDDRIIARERLTGKK